MKTGFLTFLLLVALTAAFRYADGKGTPNLIIASIYLGLANWTRTDSVIYAFGIYRTFVVGLPAFQKLYYGESLRNTYTLKVTGRMLLPRLVDGYVFVQPLLEAPGPCCYWPWSTWRSGSTRGNYDCCPC